MDDLDDKEYAAIIEGILFASGEPISVDRLCFVLEIKRQRATKILNAMQDEYNFLRRGITLLKMENKVQLSSRHEHAQYIRKAIEVKKSSLLSQSALEVLSIIAYNQPVTKPYVEQIRGVDSSYSFLSLEEKSFIARCGKLDVPGRPSLFCTTSKFLRVFGIESLKDLPELPQLNEDYEQLPFDVSENR